MAPNDPSAGGAFPRDRLVKMYLTYVTNTSITVMARFLWCYYDRAELKQKSRRERNIYFVGHACLYFAYACFIGITITQLHSLVLSETGSPLTHIHEKRHSYPDYEHGQEHDEAAHTVILKSLYASRFLYSVVLYSVKFFFLSQYVVLVELSAKKLRFFAKMTVMMTALFMVISLVSTACYCLPISRSWTPLEADVCNPFLDTRMLWALSYMNVSMDICIAMFPILSLMDMQNPGKRGSLGSVIMMTILNATPAIMAVYRYLLMMNHLSMDGISGTGPASTVAFSSTGEMLCLLAATFFPTSKLLGQRLWEIRGPKIEKTIIWMFLVAIWDTIKWYFAKLFPTKQDLEDLDEKDSGDESKRDSQHSEDPPSPTGSKSNLSKSVSQTSQMQTPVRIWSNRISRRIGWTSSHINSSDQSINIALTSLNPNTSNRNQRMSRVSTYPVMNEEQPSGIPRYFEFNPVQSTESVNGLRSLPSPVPFKSGHRRREYSIDHTNTGSEGRVEPSTTI